MNGQGVLRLIELPQACTWWGHFSPHNTLKTQRFSSHLVDQGMVAQEGEGNLPTSSMCWRQRGEALSKCTLASRDHSTWLSRALGIVAGHCEGPQARLFSRPGLQTCEYTLVQMVLSENAPMGCLGDLSVLGSSPTWASLLSRRLLLPLPSPTCALSRYLCHYLFISQIN